jgi:hypothetical protein
MPDISRHGRPEVDLEFTLGELLGRLNHIVPALAALEKFAGQLSSEQASIKKDLELARKEIENFIEETKRRLEEGQRSISGTEKTVGEQGLRITSVENARKTNGHRSWEIVMILFSNLITAVLTAITAYLLFRAGVGHP